MEPDFINKRITELRIKKGIAEHRMSLELGHSRSYMQGISSGRSLPSMTEFLAVCDYLGVSPSDFFDESKANPPLIEEINNKIKDFSDDDLLLLLNIVNRFRKQ